MIDLISSEIQIFSMTDKSDSLYICQKHILSMFSRHLAYLNQLYMW